MKMLLKVILICLAFVFSAQSFAGAQQEKMKGCNKEAKDNVLSGDARKAFMSKCLKKDYVLKHKAVDGAENEGGTASVKDDGEPSASAEALASQKVKMKSCNADAKSKGLKGDERKKFMSACLKA